MAAIEIGPSETLVGTLADRTGVPEYQIRLMALAGWEPWLIEPSDTAGKPGEAFENYLSYGSVLLTHAERPRRWVAGWRPWLSADPKRTPMWRACPECIRLAPPPARSFTLVSQIPLTLSCPEHWCRIEAVLFAHGDYFAWEKAGTVPVPAPTSVVTMDQLTHTAMRTGTVTLPLRGVHAGLWFRLLRTLIDEISIPPSKLTRRSRETMARIWDAAGHQPRAGISGAWRAYEALPWPRQQAFLEAAATALHLIETHQIKALGSWGHLLIAEPHRPLPDGTIPDSVRAAEQRQDLDEALTAARADPVQAQELLALLAPKPGSKKFAQVREDLIMLGVPEGNLPPAPAGLA